MTEHDPLVSLSHMRDFAADALEMSAGKTRADFDDDKVFALAITRLVELIGEAATRIPVETRSSLPQIPWGEMIGMRNRLIHAYDLIDPDVLWDTVLRDLPELLTCLDRAISDLGGEQARR